MNPKTNKKSLIKMTKLLLIHKQKVLLVTMKKFEEEGLRLF